MIFPLDLVEVPNSERLFLNIISRQPHSYGPIRALLDTGSPKTIISAKDALRLNIPLNNTEEGDPIAGFGKGRIPSKRIKKFIFALKSKDDKIKTMEMSVNIVDVTNLRNMPQDYYNALALPTIIGMDFLRNSEMKLVVDLASHIATLESKDSN